jgi:death on curing protein
MGGEPITMAEALAIHELLIDRFGGMRGVTEHGFGKLEGALAAPYVSMFEEDLYPDLASKAGVLFFRVARSHSFSDGNKRVALVVLLEFLARHGMNLEASQDELYLFVMGTADSWSLEQVNAWLKPRLQHESRHEVPISV